MKKLLIVAQQWPEPATNAAGIRMMQLIRFFQSNHYEIHLACAVPRTEYSLHINDVIIHEIQLNDSSFDHYVTKLKPHTVLYDRFNIEEQYGWRLRENCPETIQLLDTEDLHFLRKAREKAFKQHAESTDFYHDDIALREIASMYRCDISLIISEYEVELLQEHFKIPSDLLFYLPFLIEEKLLPNKSFHERIDFIALGNLKHPPNKDSVIFLKNEIWPLIRKQLPSVNVHIYGAYADQQITQLHSEQTGFLIKGYVEDLETVVCDTRIMLAPLRYGAGLKGKLITAMQCGTPAVMTSVAAEGMYGDHPIPGFITDDIREFVQSTISLYNDASLWKEKSRETSSILKQRFNKSEFTSALQHKLDKLEHNITDDRLNNFIGAMLQHHSLKSTKYMSKWIEEKNKDKKNHAD